MIDTAYKDRQDLIHEFPSILQSAEDERRIELSRTESACAWFDELEDRWWDEAPNFYPKDRQ